MKYLTLIMLFLGACLPATSIHAKTTTITRDGWSYDRADFNASDAEVAAVKAKGRGLWLAGWAEYDINVADAGWYELWLGGCPPEWPRDVILDGHTVTRLQLSLDTGKPAGMPRDGVQFKDMNLYLTAGRHAIRFQRLGPPGVLPSVWELRKSDGSPDSCIRAMVAQSRVGEPGSPISVDFRGGGATTTADYELFWHNEATDETVPAGRVSFAAGGGPSVKTVAMTFPKAGLYTLRARLGDRWLRPADIKSGYFLAAAVQAKPVVPAPQEQPFQFAEPFSSGAVLQREKPLPVWGWSRPGDRVTVSLAGQTEKAVTDADGRWQVTFKPINSGGGPLELKAHSDSGKTIVCKDVLIGEVWLLSGQSNMGGPLLHSIGGAAAAKAADQPDVRLMVAREGVEVPGGVDRLGQSWWGRAVAGGNAAKAFASWNAIPFAFGMEIHAKLDVPVGLISDNRGGTFISTWISPKLHETNPSLRAIADAYRSDEQERVPELLHLNRLAGQVRKWRAECAKAAAAGKPAPKEPVLTSLIRASNGPGLNYDRLIKPLGSFAIRGVLWYQGENDSAMAAAYEERFRVLVKNWRDLWQEPDLPFLYAQIAYGSGAPYTGKPEESRGAELKQSQFMGMSIPHTAMIVTNDLMRPDDNVHYLDKLPVGHRFALAALATVYERNVAYSGPIYKAQHVEGNKIRLVFAFSEGGLATGDGGKLGGFTIAGADRTWFNADAVIDGETVLVSSPRVPHPVAVRYSWADQPSGGNLVNHAGLPSPVFRTDDWPLTTAGVLWEKKN